MGLFQNNKYARWYNQLMERAQCRVPDGYVERHHIVPRSLGGSDLPSNLVALTAKEHFVAHHLLTKMCTSTDDAGRMWNAFFLMHSHSTANRYYSSRTYELAKKLMAEHKRTLTGKRNHYFGRKHSDETRAKMREKRVGRVCRSDKNIYVFDHVDGRSFSGTQQEFYNTFSLCRKGVNAIVKGTYNSYKGWVCQQGKNG